MKTLGLIGGTSWLSTIDYYRLINAGVNERLGGLNSARLLLYSVNFEEFRPPTDPGEWGEVSRRLTDIARGLINAGAECIVLCANAMHMAADAIQQSIHVPLIHIAEATAKEVYKHNLSRVGLLGTRITMEQSFFKDKLLHHRIEALVPNVGEREFIHETIFGELGKGTFTQETKQKYMQVIAKLIAEGAQGIILGCTEIPLMITQEDCPVPVFNTMTIHANAVVNFALAD
jgi:aspartate racemase